MFQGIGDATVGMTGMFNPGKMLAHGLGGGISAAMGGGSFKAGFMSAGFTAGFAPGIGNSGFSNGGQMALASLVGGTASEIGGGKFANGAVTGAMSYGFNWMKHEGTSSHGNVLIDTGNVDPEGNPIKIHPSYLDKYLDERLGIGQAKSSMTLLEAGEIISTGVPILKPAALAARAFTIYNNSSSVYNAVAYGDLSGLIGVGGGAAIQKGFMKVGMPAIPRARIGNATGVMIDQAVDQYQDIMQ